MTDLVIGIYSETCSCARGANICNFAFACIFLEFDCFLCAFCVRKMLKIPQTNKKSFIPYANGNYLFFVVSYFGLILLYNNINVAILACSGPRYFLSERESPYKSVHFSHLCEDHISK